MKDAKFCCRLFVEALESAGQKGFSILPKKVWNKDDYVFVMQGRSKDASDKTGQVSIFQQTIKFCPWCGTRLEDMVWMNKEVVKELYEKYKELILDL